MVLSKKRLLKLEEDAGVTLTPVQRVIMLFWFNDDREICWDDEDFYYGLKNVLADYPDPHPKPKQVLQPPLPPFDDFDVGIPF